MEKIMIQVEPRKADVRAVRNSGQVPVIYYGKNTVPMSLQTHREDFKRAYRKAGKSTIIYLVGSGSELMGLVHEIQYHPVTTEVEHIDVVAVVANQVVHTDVPLKFIGESGAVKLLGGTLITGRDAISVECLPKDLPHHIEVDINPLTEFHESITVADLVLPAGVKVLTAPDVMVATVSPPQKEEVTVAPAAAAPTEVAASTPAEPKEEKKNEKGK